MKIFKKIIDWCFEEKKENKKQDNTFYVPCSKFYNVSELKEDRKITANVTVKN